MHSLQLLQLRRNPTPVPLDPPLTKEGIERERANMHLLRAAAGFCPLCEPSRMLDDSGACPNPLCLCFWWGKS